MSWVYRRLLRPALFAQDSEAVHDRTLAVLALASRSPWFCRVISHWRDRPEIPVSRFGLQFPNPLGLAAGMDKHAAAVPFWAALGFGFSELGGVTWLPQPGNPRPRLFRVASEGALINRMGFNNSGAMAMAEKLADWRRRRAWPAHPVGINLGKSKATPLEGAAEDYTRTFRALWPFADFFVVNVSSPNTPNLRQLQDRSALDEILAALQEANRDLVREKGIEISDQRSESRRPQCPKPILVKLAPDLSFDALDQVLELTGPRELAGIVATNTTISRPVTSNSAAAKVYEEIGGLSGRPLHARSTEVIRHLYRQTHGQLPIIGVGGIFGLEDAWEKVTAGASLIQIYSGLIFEGPGLVKEVVAGMKTRLGKARWDDVVGSAAG